jgi:hypothetical protein
MKSIGYFDDVNHSVVSFLLQQDKLSTSHQANISSAIAYNQICDYLVTWQVVNTSNRSDVTCSIVISLRDFDILITGLNLQPTQKVFDALASRFGFCSFHK